MRLLFFQHQPVQCCLIHCPCGRVLTPSSRSTADFPSTCQPFPSRSVPGNSNRHWRWEILQLSLGLAVAMTITQTQISMDSVLRRKFKPLTSVSDFAMFFGKATYYISCHTMEVYPWNRFKLHRTIKVSNCSQSCLDIQPPRISRKQSCMVVQPVQPHKNHHELSAHCSFGPEARGSAKNHPGTPRNQSSARQKWLLASAQTAQFNQRRGWSPGRG